MALNVIADTNRLGWKGLLYEGGATQMYFVRHRWYDPQPARFVNEDPIGLSGGSNFYVFAANDPINGQDPSGELFWSVTCYKQANPKTGLLMNACTKIAASTPNPGAYFGCRGVQNYGWFANELFYHCAVAGTYFGGAEVYELHNQWDPVKGYLVDRIDHSRELASATDWVYINNVSAARILQAAGSLNWTGLPYPVNGVDDSRPGSLGNSNTWACAVLRNAGGSLGPMQQSIVGYVHVYGSLRHPAGCPLRATDW